MVAETIPVTVAEDAAARVAELGMQHEFEQMLEHTRQTISRLRQLRVTLEYDPVHPKDDPQIVIWAHREVVPPNGSPDLPEWEWNAWQVRTFPPQVFQHFVLLTVEGDVDGR